MTGCAGAGVCLVPSKGSPQVLGKFKYMSMAYLNDENMLVMKYCDKKCSNTGR